jgi:hypothetical protein
VIHTAGTVSKRRKNLSKFHKGEYGHTPLPAAELAFVKDARPMVVCIGTGQYCDLQLTTDAFALFEAYAPIVKPTPDFVSLIE